MHMRQFCQGLAILLPITFSAPVLAIDTATTPSAFVTGLAQKAFDTASDKTLSTADRWRGIDALLESGFDMPQIASFVVGPYWPGASPDERQAFTVAFRDYVGRAYSQRFADYDSASFRVVGQRKATADSTVVSTEIMQIAGVIAAEQRALDQPVRLDWLVAVRDGYRIVDVTVSGVSMAVTKRSEFTSYLRNNGGGLSSLTQRLQATTTARQ